MHRYFSMYLNHIGGTHMTNIYRVWHKDWGLAIRNQGPFGFYVHMCGYVYECVYIYHVFIHTQYIRQWVESLWAIWRSAVQHPIVLKAELFQGFKILGMPSLVSGDFELEARSIFLGNVQQKQHTRRHPKKIVWLSLLHSTRLAKANFMATQGQLIRCKRFKAKPVELWASLSFCVQS